MLPNINMRTVNYIYIALVTIVVMTSCDKLGFLKQQERVLLATVGEKEFYFDDLDTLLFKGLSTNDSLLILDAYVDRWVKNELKINESSLALSNKQLQDIERKIEDYRISLITFGYDRALASKVDTVVLDSEINDYYNDNKRQFQLMAPIVQAQFVVYDKDSKQEKKFKELVDSRTNDAKIDLIDLANKGSLRYSDYTDKWYYFNDIVNVIPFTDKNLDSFLKHNNSYEVTENDMTYYLKVQRKRISGDYMPIEMVKSTIKMAILNERRKDYIKEVEDSLYSVSLKNGTVKIEMRDTIKQDTLQY